MTEASSPPQASSPAPLGVLQRALSRRGDSFGGSNTGTTPVLHPFDSKRVLPHVDEVHEDVTSSSPTAMASLLMQSRQSSKQLMAAPAPADGGGVGPPSPITESEEKEEADDVEEDEPGDAPPLKRGIISSEGTNAGSRDLIRCLSLDEVDTTPRWEVNMQMDLGEFDRDSVTYLAEGAMCQCFLARKTPASMNIPESLLQVSQEGVVIKTPIEGGPAVAENDLIVESLVLRELSHPNIITLFGGGEGKPTGESFIVLEFLAMGTLRDRLDKCGGGLGVQPAVKYGQQLTSALAYMHDGALPGMILMHRDLKPDNIGFSSSGAAKLMDFGLAKVINRTTRCGSAKYVMTGETGSPRYMSPEVAKSQPYNEKADVWSFIIILWEMVAGRLPFAGMNMEMYLARVCEGGERPVVQNQWPADIKSVLKSGWQSDPDKRPSFREVEAVLTGVHHDFAKPKKKGLFGRG